MTTKNKRAKDFIEELDGPLNFGRMLEFIRLTHESSEEGLSQPEFAKMLGISPTYLNDLEKGRKIPSTKKAEEIANILQMPANIFVQMALKDRLHRDGYAINERGKIYSLKKNVA